mmetsp:Transcript_7498/g.11430  ORF Transcript_7498/g.11430 Transcript_7498/m.11430 type:complete len:98 (+) Transcript_7498:400-693(+)
MKLPLFILANKIKDHYLEKLTDPDRAVIIRRAVYSHRLSTLPTSNSTTSNSPIDALPHLRSLNYSSPRGEAPSASLPEMVSHVHPVSGWRVPKMQHC